MKKISISLIAMSLTAIVLTLCIKIAHAYDGCLAKPTGQYGVGYKELLWTDTDRCQSSSDDSMTKECHKIPISIYYPTNQLIRQDSNYSLEFLKQSICEYTNMDPSMVLNLLERLDIKSFAVKNDIISSDKKFPLVIFLPGYSTPTQSYENIITELASHGYIVVGINNAEKYQALPQGWRENIEQFEPMLTKAEDVVYVLKALKNNSNEPIFSAIDMSHVGAVGHSLGANSIAELANKQPNLLQAIATLDMSKFIPEKSLTTPSMHLIAANRSSEEFAFYNGYKVVISPNRENQDYSAHADFTDVATIVPLLKNWLNNTGMGSNIAFNIKNYSLFGAGGGLKIIETVNTYLVKFFDTILKEQKDFVTIYGDKPLTDNTYIQFLNVDQKSDL